MFSWKISYYSLALPVISFYTLLVSQFMLSNIYVLPWYTLIEDFILQCGTHSYSLLNFKSPSTCVMKHTYIFLYAFIEDIVSQCGMNSYDFTL